MSSPLVRAQGLRRERTQASPRFLDGSFRNTAPPPSPGGPTLRLLGEWAFGGQQRRPQGALPTRDPRPSWAAAPETGFRTTWLGHSTVLLELDGFRVLTDPVWSLRASPVQFAGPKRFAEVPTPIEDLPPLHAVIISHDHFDHLDRASILRLARRDDVPFVTSLGVGAHLEAWGVEPHRIHELDWWESIEPSGGGLEITAAPSQHFSGRTLRTRNQTLWSSFAIRTERRRVFFSGDTGLTPEYVDIARRLGPFDLVMLEVGAFHPAWGDIHLGPDQAMQAWSHLGASRLLPVHWGTFSLALHAWDQPAERLLELAGDRKHDLLMPRLGAAVEPDRVELVEPWWRPEALPQRASSPRPALG